MFVPRAQTAGGLKVVDDELPVHARGAARAFRLHRQPDVGEVVEMARLIGIGEKVSLIRVVRQDEDSGLARLELVGRVAFLDF